jgi:hypothetical protein
MPTTLDDTFTIEDGLLVRRVTPSATSRRQSKPYAHTCTQTVYEEVAYAIDDLEGATFTGESIRETIDAPFTQVMVAMAFLRERGCITSAHGRKNVPASTFLYEDAMLEWHAMEHALREKRVE